MITEVVLGFLILTPFVLLAMLLTRNPKTRERISSPSSSELNNLISNIRRFAKL